MCEILLSPFPTYFINILFSVFISIDACGSNSFMLIAVFYCVSPSWLVHSITDRHIKVVLKFSQL